MSYYRDQLEDWLKTIDVKADRVLDIGGGALPVKGRTKSWGVKEYLIADNNAEGDFNPDIRLDLNEPVTDTGHPYCTFDIVFCLEVFEYVYTPLDALKHIHLFLKEGGVAYISFPFVYPWHEPKEKDYLRYTQQGIRQLLRQAGFKSVAYVPRKDRSGKLAEFYKADGMHPVRGADHSITGWLVRARA